MQKKKKIQHNEKKARDDQLEKESKNSSLALVLFFVNIKN